MKTCNACHIDVYTKKEFCPLCDEPLSASHKKEPAYRIPENEYPTLGPKFIRYNFVKRLLLFITLFGCGISILINWLVTPQYWWSAIVLALALYCWLTIPPMLRRGANVGTQVIMQVVLTSAFVVLVDFYAGYKGWSVSFVVPSLLCAGLLAIALMVIFNRTNWAQYVLSQVTMGVFGFIPLILYLLGVAQSLVMALVAAGLGLASLLVTIIFGDRTIKSEFKRRFHF